MAINFPDNPPDGEVYTASNGVVYTYNAATDTWTGSSAAGDNYWKETDDGSAVTPVEANENLQIDGNGFFNSYILVKRDIADHAAAEVGLCFSSGAFDSIDDDELGISIKEQGAALDNGIYLSAAGNAFFSGKLTSYNYNISALQSLPEV